MQWSDVMSWLPKRSPPKPRSAPRQSVDGFMSQIGPLLDISGTGMRVRFEEENAVTPGTVLNFQVHSAGRMFSIRGMVIWKRKQKKSHASECGVRFLDLSPEHRALIEHIARFGVMPRQGEKVTGNPGAGAGATRPTPPPPPPARNTVSIEIEDLYSILGVTPNANDEQIRRAYRELARKLHPDSCKDADATEKFTLLGKAYTVLRDPDLRAKYDQMRSRTAA